MSAISQINLFDDYEPQFHRVYRDSHPGKQPFAPVRLTEVQDFRSPAMAWVDEAPCSETDPEDFFGGPHEHAKAARAKAICAGCKVATPCLEYALSVDPAHDWGIWGGTTESERNEIRKERTGGLAA